jgi:CRP-like cAMP-binding protein
MRPARLESVLALLPYFSRLRTDEQVRIAARFVTVALPPGGELALDQPRLVIVVDGEARLVRGGSTVRLFSGDTFGEIELATGRAAPARVVAETAATVATLDREALDGIFADYPAAALPWLRQLGRELKWRNDALREVSLAYAEKLPPSQLEAVLSARRRRLARHRRTTVGDAIRRLLRTIFLTPVARPSFWVMVGVLSALAAARTVVALIIANGLQKHLFALIGGSVGHPIHVHHFNYGLALVSLTSLLLLLPRTRGALRRLAFVFGFGVGLIVDEFALLWNLNPDYYQPSSRLVAAAVIVAIAQVVYLRAFWAALARRVLRS